MALAGVTVRGPDAVVPGPAGVPVRGPEAVVLGPAVLPGPAVALEPGAATPGPLVLGPFTLSIGPQVALAQAEQPTPTQRPRRGRPRLDKPSVPVRIQVPSLGIDLPVMSSNETLPGNPRLSGDVPFYPLCDVAQHWVIYDLPGAPGTAWIYAHAQPGMFLPLLDEAVATDGDGLLGRDVEVQLRDGRVLVYRISDVRQHSTDRTIAARDRPGGQRLVLQTSEGPPGTIPKLMMAARLVNARFTDEPAPEPRPRVCSDAPRPTPRPTRVRPSPSASAVVDPNGGASGGGSPDVTGVMLGFGVALTGGAVLLTIWLRRRPA